jgi:hypothetical protein
MSSESGERAPATLINQTKWPGYSDDTHFHDATPALQSINGTWHL